MERSTDFLGSTKNVRPLNTDQVKKWNQYCIAENDRIRSVLLEKLDIFINSIINSDISQYEDWVYELSTKVVDGNDSFPVRMPLFEKVLFPVLFEGYKLKKPGCARWLAGFHQLIYKSKKAKEALGDEFTLPYLLEKALVHDPKDDLAREKLARSIASRLEYAIHEVPWGVLWDINGANIEQCELLKNELQEFKCIIKICGLEERYESLINECTIHFNEYQRYLRKHNDHESYEAYLLSSVVLHTN
jgi:hypothetical protein